jgi:hypothetical protein
VNPFSVIAHAGLRIKAMMRPERADCPAQIFDGVLKALRPNWFQNNASVFHGGRAACERK